MNIKIKLNGIKIPIILKEVETAEKKLKKIIFLYE